MEWQNRSSMVNELLSTRSSMAKQKFNAVTNEVDKQKNNADEAAKHNNNGQ